MVREVKEETGLDIFNFKFLCVKANIHVVYPNQDEVYYTDVVYFANEYKGNLEHDEESLELKWFKLDDIPSDIFSNNKEYIEKFKKEYL